MEWYVRNRDFVVGWVMGVHQAIFYSL